MDIAKYQLASTILLEGWKVRKTMQKSPLRENRNALQRYSDPWLATLTEQTKELR